MLISNMGALELVLIIVAIVIVAFVLKFQLQSSKETREKIRQLADFFPNDSSLELVKSSITNEILQSKTKLEQFISNPPARHAEDNVQFVENDVLEEEEKIEYYDVDLIHIKNGVGSTAFKEVVHDTNAYLCKNVGTSADFSIIQDICERKIDSLQAQISNIINVPLYLGLAGTFAGIITGLLGIAFNVDSLFAANVQAGGNSSMSPLTNLLIGVVIAMFASFIGLFLMTKNSSVHYKEALRTCDQNKNGYYDFIRRELMPVLSNSMASSLNSLRGVLGEFIGKFGHNLDAYANSAELLNDNIEKQHLLLVEINKMKSKEIATGVAEAFKDMKDSSESFGVFRTYQENLNETIQKVDTTVSKFDSIVNSFDNFAKTLQVVVDNQDAAGKLQSQFRAAIEKHFPIGSDAREEWRKQFDALTTDAQAVSEDLHGQLKASTDYIKAFVQDNQAAFSSLSNLQVFLDSLKEYADVQASCYKDMKDEIKNLKTAQINAQKDNAEITAKLLEAVKALTETIKNSKN